MCWFSALHHGTTRFEVEPTLNNLMINKINQSPFWTSIMTMTSSEDSQRAEYAKKINTEMNPITTGCRWCSIHDLIIVLPFCKSRSAREHRGWIWAFTNLNLETWQCNPVSCKLRFPLTNLHNQICFGGQKDIDTGDWGVRPSSNVLLDLNHLVKIRKCVLSVS